MKGLIDIETLVRIGKLSAKQREELFKEFEAFLDRFIEDAETRMQEGQEAMICC